MSKSMSQPISSATIGNYPALLADIKQRIRTAQVRTAMAGNAGMLMLYWEIGGVLAKRQKNEGWGTAVLPRLANDLHNDLPDVKGFSARNLRLMIQFFDEYSSFGPIWQRPVAKLPDQPSAHEAIWPRPVAKLKNRGSAAPKGPLAVAQFPTAPDDASIWQRAVAQLTWAHNVILIPDKAEYAGKMNFYLNAVDDRMRHADDQPSIGLILCEEKNKIIAEYALRGMDKAIGVSDYQLTRALPKKLQSALPSIAQIEAELSTPTTAKPARKAAGGKRK